MILVSFVMLLISKLNQFIKVFTSTSMPVISAVKKSKTLKRSKFFFMEKMFTWVCFQLSWKDCFCTMHLDGKTGYGNNSLCLVVLPPHWSKCLAKLSLVELQLLESCPHHLWCFLNSAPPTKGWVRSMNLTHDSRRKKRIPDAEETNIWPPPGVNPRAFFHLRCCC